jgi:alginate O-acetyltransferase complex protein AlgI
VNVRAAAWALAGAAVIGALHLTAAQAAGVRMLAVIGALLVAMKALMIAEWRGPRPTLAQALTFALAGPAMDPAPFLRARGTPRPARPLALRGAFALIAGAALFALARETATRGSALALWMAVAAFSLMVHFGALSLLTAAWQHRGIAADVAFEAPWRPTSLGAFWGRSWNPAFTALTAAAVYRPVARRCGTTAGLGAAFLFSGVLHELAISVPVRAGFGRPLAYFALHGALVALERAIGTSWLARHPGLARVWTLAWLVLPLPVLFHQPFLEGVVRPLVSR